MRWRGRAPRPDITPAALTVLVLLGSLLAGCGTARTAVPDTTDSSATPTASSGTAVAGSIALPVNSDWTSRGIRVQVGLGGGPTRDMVVDTGSNGVVVSRKYLGPAARPLSPRQLFAGFTYSSSGTSYSGEWMLTPLTIESTTGTGPIAQTVPILVRAVDQRCTKAGSCSTDTDVAMLGVGFDRAQDGGAAPANSGPGINPFLHVVGMDSGTVPRAYLITHRKVVLGPGATDTAGFTTVTLQRTTGSQPLDWQAPTVSLAVEGSVPPQSGSLLLDTGLDYAIAQVPTGIQPPTVPSATAGGRPTVADGQHVSVTLPTGFSVYRFVTGAAGAPQSVQWGHNLHQGVPFFNISRFALTQTDYLFDDGAGQVGFRPAG